MFIDQKLPKLGFLFILTQCLVQAQRLLEHMRREAVYPLDVRLNFSFLHRHLILTLPVLLALMKFLSFILLCFGWVNVQLWTSEENSDKDYEHY